MFNSTLVAHNPKFAAKLTPRADLALIPEPKALGLRHKPIPHHILVDRITEEIERRDFVIAREQFALAADGQALFGVLDLQPSASLAVRTDQVRGLSFGFRTSTNSTLAIKAVAGTRVFVCDNLALSGDMIAFNRKSTTHLDLLIMISQGVDMFMTHEQTLDVQISELEIKQLSDGQAKQQIFDVFNQGLVPVRLFPDVAQHYFKPTDQTPDCQPRTAWGLHNAFTRAMRDLPPLSLFGASMKLGKAFGLGSGDVLEGEVLD